MNIKHLRVMIHTWFECKVRYEKMMENGSQNKMIKEHLMEGKGLTALGALFKFRCMNLKGRIHDLRKEGLPIETEMIEVNGKRVAIYKLSKNN